MKNQDDLIQMVENWEFDFEDLDEKKVAVLQDEIENLIPHCIDSAQPGSVFEQKFRTGCVRIAERHGVRLEGEGNEFAFRAI